jgi:hypothetical protein
MADPTVMERQGTSGCRRNLHGQALEKSAWVASNWFSLGPLVEFVVACTHFMHGHTGWPTLRLRTYETDGRSNQHSVLRWYREDFCC